MKIVIIDPTSPEFNRGSFCYLPYILYAYHRAVGNEVILLEDFTAASIDSLPDADEYLVAVWSYPQLELAKVLRKYLRKIPQFFGYTPLLEAEGLTPASVLSDEVILLGIENYFKYYGEFKTILLSDCDMHLKKYEGVVYPLFTSYGCPKGCAFCPSTVNCNRKRLVLPIEAVEKILTYCAEHDIHNIHFTDEDFFFDTERTKRILDWAADLGCFKFIAMGSVHAVQKFQDTYPGVMQKSGMKLIEVGFETADDELSKAMGKPANDAYKKLAESCEVDVFWLTLSFFPGETITTLNRTGEFLKQYGFEMEELYGRIRTNSTEGGLGQFFQPYHGTKGFDDLFMQGKILSERPLRLIPSFIPYSFLHSKITECGEIKEEHRKWFELYRVPDTLPIRAGYTVQALIERSKVSEADATIFYAICARLSIIK